MRSTATRFGTLGGLGLCLIIWTGGCAEEVTPSQQNNPPPNNPYCGDGICSASESTFNCAIDCSPRPATDTSTPTPYCGDGACNGNESQLTCAQDCGSPGTDTTTPAPYCGDGACNGNESQLTCAQDCGEPPTSTCANAADGTPCDDGNPSTSNDACLNGTCQGQASQGSQGGWFYQFNPGISGRFSRIRIQQLGGINWSPWVSVADEWASNYMGTTFPGTYPDYSVEIQNDCMNPDDAAAFTNAALSSWFTTSGSGLSKPGWLVLRSADGSKEVVLSTIEASIQSYSPPHGSCTTQEDIAIKALKMKIVDCEIDDHCGPDKHCSASKYCQGS